VALLLLVVAISGWAIFGRAKEDSLAKADAVVILGGEHDGRESYGAELVRRGLASVLVLSNPYPASDPVMRSYCRQAVRGVAEVVCMRPVPSTTEGEAAITRQLAKARGWRQVIVVSWRYHLPRARFIFEQCLRWRDSQLIFRAVPRDYGRIPLGYWEFIVIYQYFAFVKAIATVGDDCR
jgi:uncharacterized SAM-binding protein YcdF (DUF218 family)